jgi:signal transduction histidine kinase/ActR/RegA family two-component response regulator
MLLIETGDMSAIAASLISRNYRLLFEKAPEALLAVTEGTLRITAANDRALQMLASTQTDIEYHTLHAILSPEDLDRLVALFSAGLLTGEIQNCKVRNVEGAWQEADVAITRIPDDQVVVVALHDISARIRLNDQLRQAQKMEGLGMLAGGIAHDFNNLLTIISGYSQMLLASHHMTTERDRTAIQQVLKASERAADLTSQLLAFSRRQTIQPKVLEINQIVDQTLSMLRRLIGEDIDLSIRKAPDAGRIHADPGQIQQVIMNLAINSRDAMPQGGSLVIRTNNAELSSDYIGQHFSAQYVAGQMPGAKPGRYVRLEVTDTGSGMDEATRKRVFEPFFTTKPQGKGTGLGLSTVYGIVRQCGGSIDLYSEPEQGTTFVIYLPRVEDIATEEWVEETEPAGGQETVLLVEDEDGVRKMVRMALERRGYHVLVAASGPEALSVAHDFDGAIDLLVTDMIMPHMNGKQLATLLLEQRPETAVLFISGYTGNTLLSTGALELEAEFLQKPFAAGALTAKVRHILDGGRRSPGRSTSSGTRSAATSDATAPGGVQ